MSAAKRTLTAVFGLEAWAPSEPSQLPPGRLEEEPNSTSSSSRHVFVLMSSQRSRPLPMTRSQIGPAPKRKTGTVNDFRLKKPYLFNVK